MHCAAALQAVGGAAEAPAVLDVLLPAWAENVHTARVAVPCLERMGPAAAPAVPLLRAWLARPDRGGAFSRSDRDEELRHTARATLAGLGADPASDAPDAADAPAGWPTR
ncbi:hypothetical protein HUT16_09795 [Kitasatospora sp. NA04385]|uniref:hypothetical protein n=1 Tax=Kitasatospora sp. NA04385 TaxID=2742135 RepID=UPI00158FBEB3|nr:hypothetical protein [Kitasatospora sp. NA04385]QKW17647.1 hypothetical protein HUT16_09795 [Kitasatospora sp. NA04385]